MLAKVKVTKTLFFAILFMWVPLAKATDAEIVQAIKDSATERKTVIEKALSDAINFYTGSEYAKNLVDAEDRVAPAPGENEALLDKDRMLISKYGPIIAEVNNINENDQIKKNMATGFFDYFLFNKDYPAANGGDILNPLEHKLSVHFKGYCDPTKFNIGGGLLRRDKICKEGDPNFINKDLNVDIFSKNILTEAERTAATRAFLNTIPINDSLKKILDGGQEAFRRTENREKAAKLLADAAIFSSVNAFYSNALAQRKSVSINDDKGNAKVTSELKAMEDVINNTFRNKQWHTEVENTISVVALLKGLLQQVALANQINYKLLEQQEYGNAMLASQLSLTYQSSLAVDKILSQGNSSLEGLSSQ